MRCRRVLTLGPENEPQWVQLFISQTGESWAAMIVADGIQPPQSGELRGLAFFGDTPEEAERQALAYLGQGEPKN